MLIDVAISGDRNVIKKEAEKILECKDLTISIHIYTYSIHLFVLKYVQNTQMHCVGRT